jgi:hypothetical protein
MMLGSATLDEVGPESYVIYWWNSSGNRISTALWIREKSLLSLALCVFKMVIVNCFDFSEI